MSSSYADPERDIAEATAMYVRGDIDLAEFTRRLIRVRYIQYENAITQARKGRRMLRPPPWGRRF